MNIEISTNMNGNQRMVINLLNYTTEHCNIINLRIIDKGHAMNEGHMKT